MTAADSQVRIADLPTGRPSGFDLEPDAAVRAELAESLGLDALRKLRFRGEIAPEGPADWRLSGDLGATVVQSCVVTLAPVTTRIDVPVARLYLAEPPALPEGAEVEMPEDDSQEPLPAVLDLQRVMAEALALAVPLYPRAPGAELGDAAFTEPGARPLTDADVKPFAGLAALRDKLAKPDD